MHPFIHAQSTPDKPAFIMAGTGAVVTYAELDRRSNQGAQFFRSLGLKVGDVIALCMENNAQYLEISWATQRSGLYLACISSKLTASEVEYIVKDCGAKVFITSIAMGGLIDDLVPLLGEIRRFIVGDKHRHYESFEAATSGMPTTPVADQTTGADMLYSSGTTGRPKGIKLALTGAPIDSPNTLTQLASAFFKIDASTIYLSP